MRVLQYEARFPFPAARLELSLSTRDEPIAPREYAVVIDVVEPDGSAVPKGMLNWGFSAPLGGPYQYVPPTPAGGLSVIPLPVLTDRPIGELRVTVVAWKPVVTGADPADAFDRLLVTFSAEADASQGATGARFSTVRRADRG